MGNFMPAEQSGLTNDYRLLMSQGMRSFLNSHSFGIKPDMMVTKQIIEMAGCLNQCDQRVNKYKYLLRDAAERIMEISHIDTKDWDLMKLATALMMICCPEEKNAAPRWLFPRKQLKIFRKHAPQYENKILKVHILVAYNDIYRARKLRYQVAWLLLRMIKRDKRACEAKLASEAASDHEIGTDGKKDLI
ncbi:hypothetical protein C2845_PM03G26340 [Panicum miliaceum]|uniref:Uncharacterized protein n=1 Tax=Panicum miliaceum TaxID=4540 RepID=A0A3L6T8I5_PANMI|nr:hypothetical protein C2845_PM03G26340 [Panicum miliaceum]